MKNLSHFKKPLLGALLASIFTPQMVYAALMDLSALPPGLMAIPPTPNVIMTVDDSGSMTERLDKNKNYNAITNPYKIDGLKEALVDVFSDTVLLRDGKIRLAWQAMFNTNNNALTPGATNSMKLLEGDVNAVGDNHRKSFIAFAKGLSAPGNHTPSHKMMKQAYDYMRTTGSNSPWADKPGDASTGFLACRRSYHIFMTDGAWNQGRAGNRPSDVDGVTNSNTDGLAKTLPNGLEYTVTGVGEDQTRVYRDAEGDTLSDWAMKMWREDLQPGINNLLTPSTIDGVLTTEPIGTIALKREWNPKHDPATWQHVVTYTIGYGKSAYEWAGNPKWPTAIGAVGGKDNNYGGDFEKLVLGTVSWPTGLSDNNSKNPAELWHMALNSRGKFYPTGPDRKYGLKDAFRNILEDINLRNTADVASVAGSASTNIRTDLNQYTAGYDPKRWSGYVRSNKLDIDGNTTANSDWGTTPSGAANTTATLLDARSVASRVILTSSDDLPNKGVSFEWEAGTAKLSAAQKLLLDGDSKGEDRVNFLRGDRTNEGGTTAKPFRIRDSRQGDIVNSNVWYVDAPASNYSFAGYKLFSSAQRNRLPMIYVGGNDGMLHGFSAVNGQEQIAYVPKAVIPDLSKLSDPDYKHRYYVDGSPFTGDLKIGSGSAAADWRTYLVGTLAAGGKGYFVLDVTEPGNKASTTASAFTTSNAASLVVLDRTLNPAEPVAATSDDEDIGHIFAAPVMDDTNAFKATQIAKLNDDRWAVLMGNGYNSKNERPVLLIQYLDGAKELKRIVATGSQAPSSPVSPSADTNVIGNGLSAPRLVDINSDGRVDVVYAGDLKGNMWKFDLTSDTAANWGVAGWGASAATPCTTGTCTPLFTAIYSGKRQAITAPPVVKANDRGAGGLMVAFGTGVNLTDNDRSSTEVHSVYSVLDNTRYKLVSGNKLVEANTNAAPKTIANPGGGGAIPGVVAITDLVKQDMVSSTPIAGQGKSSAREFWKMTQNSVNYADATNTLKKGWYFNFQVTGERVLRPMSFFDGSNNLMVFSTTPAYGGNGSAEESCEPAGTPEKAYLTLMNIMDGKKPGVQVMDANGDGFYNSAAGKDDGVSRMSLPPGAISNVAGKKTTKMTGGDGKPDELARMPEQPMRPSWRQLQ